MESRADAQAVEAFLARLDDGYRRSHGPDEAAAHLAMASSLTPRRPVAVASRPRDDGRSEVVVVAYDYFGAFSLVCGVLAAHALDVETGDVHTLEPVPAPRGGRARSRPAPGSSRQIVDVFHVRPRDPARPPDSAALESEMGVLFSLASEGRIDEARERLCRRLVESLTRAPREAGEVLPRVDVDLDDEASPPWTRMRVRGRDTPGFLYALANALAMRRVYVHSVRIESLGTEVHDEFLIGRAGGGPLVAGEERETLRLAVVLIKQFTDFLPWAPDPARALRYFDQLLDRVAARGDAGRALRLLRGPAGLEALARVLGSSAFLWEDFFRTQFEHIGPLLTEWKARPLETRAGLESALGRRLRSSSSWEDTRRALNTFKDEAMVRASAKRLLDARVTVEDFSRALTDLAEVVLEAAARACLDRLAAEHGGPVRDGRPCPLALLGLGKLGGGELGYASDVELLAVYAGSGQTDRTGLENGRFFDLAVQALSELIEARQEGFMHVDLRLRPHGNKGPLATPLDALGEYYRPGGGAHPFERQALVKLRFVAGDLDLGRRVEAFRDAYVWSDEPWNLAEALHLRDRQRKELVKPGRFNVKYSRGALVDVEYSAQYLQLQHGRELPVLRTPSTLAALGRLLDAGLLAPEEHRDLREGYLFWRQVVDGLRMVRGDAQDVLLPEAGSEELALLARRLGYPPDARREGGAALAVDAAGHSERVAAFFDRRFGG